MTPYATKVNLPCGLLFLVSAVFGSFEHFFGRKAMFSYGIGVDHDVLKVLTETDGFSPNMVILRQKLCFHTILMFLEIPRNSSKFLGNVAPPSAQNC